MRKVMFCASVDVHIRAFHLPFLKWFKEEGWEVHVVTNGEEDLPFVDFKHTIPMERSPLKMSNIKAYRELGKIISENQFDLIHCHTPIAGVLTRLASRRVRKDGTKVLYTAHGFHFYKGAPMLNWILYYPIERALSKYSDLIITINKEDYELASNKFKKTKVEYVPGVGVDTSKFISIPNDKKNDLRNQYGYKKEDFLIFYAAEFIARKNHKLLIEAMPRIASEYPNVKLLLAGNGVLLNECKELVHNTGLDNIVDFLGYSRNVLNYLQLSDLVVAPSLSEGLPVNVMEAMSCELPVVATDIRGHRDLINENITGYIVKLNDTTGIYRHVANLINDSWKKVQMGVRGRSVIEEDYSLKSVMIKMKSIYKEFS